MTKYRPIPGRRGEIAYEQPEIGVRLTEAEVATVTDHKFLVARHVHRTGTSMDGAPVQWAEYVQEFTAQVRKAVYLTAPIKKGHHTQYYVLKNMDGEEFILLYPWSTPIGKRMKVRMTHHIVVLRPNSRQDYADILNTFGDRIGEVFRDAALRYVEEVPTPEVAYVI